MAISKEAVARAEHVRAALADTAYTYTDEASLHHAIADQLEAAGVPFLHEVSLASGDRIDFLTGSGVGVEVKVAGSLDSLVRQLRRYSLHHSVKALLVVTTRTSHHRLPTEVNGTPVLLLSLIGAGL